MSDEIRDDNPEKVDELDNADRPGLPELYDGENVLPGDKLIHERTPLESAEKLTTPEILEVYALRLAAIKGKRINTKLFKKNLNAEQIRLWQRLSMVPGLMLQDRLISQALNGVKHECRVCGGLGKLRKKVADGPVEIECERCKGRGWVKGAPDPRLVKLAHDAAIDLKDRTMGKATENVQIAQAVKVVMGGLDLDRLPQPKPIDAEIIDTEDE